ncbi:UDP-Glycosyltransferase superfamily protein [Artemisia annua]|uniref:UDP-Glycosyltransferase superfamily protein n=1 Tax=Artemisia annua TaxID=35608 RepID=A0A2U1L7F2_ARTAN|nr:UDP-Glycosyltransferase superfamily protein [Artemisia annua]
MAFGIPVLGTDARGTKEIVEHNVTGLLHPVGHPGTTVLSKNLQYLLKNPSERQRMGLEGREKVKKMYLKRHMYKMFWQGLGETFGRVTIEAMTFGIPVLGTDAGGTKEIVEHNVTGLLHPVGHPGTTVLSKNLQYLLKNPSERQRMGLEGREKVKKMYLKRHMYKMFWQVLYDTMK